MQSVSAEEAFVNSYGGDHTYMQNTQMQNPYCVHSYSTGDKKSVFTGIAKKVLANKRLQEVAKGALIVAQKEAKKHAEEKLAQWEAKLKKLQDNPTNQKEIAEVQKMIRQIGKELTSSAHCNYDAYTTAMHVQNPEQTVYCGSVADGATVDSREQEVLWLQQQMLKMQWSYEAHIRQLDTEIKRLKSQSR